MADIKNNLLNVRENIPKDVLLVAVTKTHTPAEINTAIDNGVTDIGENKVQEILDKYDKVKPVRWHMIGHLQSNKVKYIVDKVDLIHSVDSLKLAKEIDKRASEHGKKMNILVQVNIAEEESKFGILSSEVENLINSILNRCPNVIIKGIMSVAPFEENPENVRGFFAEAKKIYDTYAKIKHDCLDFEYLSMGMTHDYKVAIEEGSNLVRIGTAIFGSRSY